MQAIFQRHLNERIAVAFGKKPAQVTLLHSEPDYFTVDTFGGSWTHVPHSAAVSVTEFGDPQKVKTVQRTVLVRLVVAMDQREEGGAVFGFGMVFRPRAHGGLLDGSVHVCLGSESSDREPI